MSGRGPYASVAAAGVFVGLGIIACSSFTGSPSGVAGPDASPMVDASAPFCPSRPDAALCADFDNGDPVSFHFINAEGDVGIDLALSRSPPGSMRAVANASNAYLRGQVVGGAFAIKQRLSFDTYPGRPGAIAQEDAGVPEASLVSVLLQGNNGCSFAIESYVTQALLTISTPELDGGRTYERLPMTAYPPPGRWSHVDILLEKEAGGTFATVRIDNALALPRLRTGCPLLAADPYVYIGILEIDNSPKPIGEAHFDNVLVESE